MSPLAYHLFIGRSGWRLLHLLRLHGAPSYKLLGVPLVESIINRSPNRSWLTWLFNRRSTVPSYLQMPMLWFALASDESPVRSESFIPPPFSPVWTRPSNEDLPTARWGSALPLESTPGFEEWEQLVQLLELPRYWTTNIWASYLASPWDEREGRFDSNPGPDL